MWKEEDVEDVEHVKRATWHKKEEDELTLNGRGGRETWRQDGRGI